MRPLAAQPFDPSLCFVVSLRMDVVDLRNFYAHPLGTVARRFVGRGIRRLWSGSAGLRVLGVGYATPYLGLFREDAERCLAFMPAAQGVVKWPSARPTLVALVDECELPLPDAAIDRILLVHALELSHDVAALLREVWRVLASGGRILAVVPNRRGVWARMERSAISQFMIAQSRITRSLSSGRPDGRLRPDPVAPSGLPQRGAAGRRRQNRLQHRFEGWHQFLLANGNRPIDLLCRFYEMHPCEWRRHRRAAAFPG